MKKLLIIDGMNLAHRAHSVHFEIKTSQDVLSGTFYGFLKSVGSLRKRYGGYDFYVCWDNKAEHKRKILPEYKAGRGSLSDSMASQIRNIRAVLPFCNVVQWECPAQEADDVIASIVEYEKMNFSSIIIYSNDKDMLQLVEGSKVIVYRPKVGSVPEKFFDEDVVKAEYMGLSGDRYAIFKSFDKDPSDNISGIPRVPRKLIASHILNHSDVGSVFDSILGSALTDFQRRSFQDGRSRVEANYRVIHLDRALAGIEKTESSSSEEGIMSYLEKYEIKSIRPCDLLGLRPSSFGDRTGDAEEIEEYSLFE